MFTVKLSPKPAAQVEAKHAAPPAEPDRLGVPVALSQHVSGLTALRVRAPGHERIELAIDERGGVHLLTRESILRELPIVESWTRAHRELIALACPQHTFDFARPIISHIFTDSPASLCDLHATGLRLHVLAPVQVGDQTGWYSAALNG